MENTRYEKLRESDSGCFRRWFHRRQEPETDDIFETIRKINNTMRSLTVHMDQMNRAKERKLQETLGHREHNRRFEARTCLMVYKRYEQTYRLYFGMQQNLEVIKLQIQQAQTAAVMTNGLSAANETLERFMKQVNLSMVEDLMDKCREQMDEGNDVMFTLADPNFLNDGVVEDDEELDMELDALVETGTVSPLGKNRTVEPEPFLPLGKNRPVETEPGKSSGKTERRSEPVVLI